MLSRPRPVSTHACSMLCARRPVSVVFCSMLSSRVRRRRTTAMGRHSRCSVGKGWGELPTFVSSRLRSEQRHSLLEQSACLGFDLIAIAVRRPCLQLVETDRVGVSGIMVLDLAAAEIVAPGDYCPLK